MPSYAAALAYHLLLSLFPFLLFLFAVLTFLHIPGFYDRLLARLADVLPAQGYAVVLNVMGNMEERQSAGLLIAGIIAALLAGSTGVRTLMNALNAAYDIPETRPGWQRLASSFLFTVGLAMLILLAAGAMALGPAAITWLFDQVRLETVWLDVWAIARWPVLVILLMITATLTFWAIPNIRQPIRMITPGAILAVLVWAMTSVGFGLYVRNFGNYDAVYGSLGGLIILMFYFYLSSAVVLAGAEINAELYRIKLGTPEPHQVDPRHHHITPHLGPRLPKRQA